MSSTTSTTASPPNHFCRDFGRNCPKTVVELCNMMQHWVDEEEQERSRFSRRNQDNNEKRNNDRGGTSNQRDPVHKRKPDDIVGTMDRTPCGKKTEKPQDQFDKILHNKRCPIHAKSNHSMFECTIIRKSFQSPLPDAPKKKPNKEDEDDVEKDLDGFQKPENVVNVIFGGDPSFSKCAQKLLLREILSVEPTIQRPLKYSKVPFTFSREDQWTSFSELGKFPLVLDPVIQGSKLTRVLIDGGSGLKLIFASTLLKMGLNYMSFLMPSKAPFYDIVPGNSSTPIGSIILLVTFGTEQNFRTEYIKFKVADFESSYHAILGRPALPNPRVTCSNRPLRGWEPSS